MDDSKALLGQRILAAKRARGLSWGEISAQLAHSPSWVCAACLGQMAMPADLAAKTVALLGLPETDAEILTAIPYRGSLPPGPPTDPLIYRFHELVQVYGTTWKALIGEEFGDGIMSAIDFEMQVERQPHEHGDRVKITMSGKFLPYKRY